MQVYKEYNENRIINVIEILDKVGNDLTSYNMNNVYIGNNMDLRCVKFPKNRDFLKNLRWSSIVNAKMPEMDYSIYDFNGVYMEESFSLRNLNFLKIKTYLKIY